MRKEFLFLLALSAELSLELAGDSAGYRYTDIERALSKYQWDRDRRPRETGQHKQVGYAYGRMIDRVP